MSYPDDSKNSDTERFFINLDEDNIIRFSRDVKKFVFPLQNRRVSIMLKTWNSNCSNASTHFVLENV